MICDEKIKKSINCECFTNIPMAMIMMAATPGLNCPSPIAVNYDIHRINQR